jgi:hypothetical protein
VNRDLPKEIDRVILKALQRNRDLRYPDAAAFRAAIEAFIAAQGLKGTQQDVVDYLRGLYADRIVAERDESRQNVLWGTLDEEPSSASLPPDVKPGPVAAVAAFARDEEDTLSSEVTLPAEGAGIRMIGGGPRPHTTAINVPQVPSGRWRIVAAVAAAVLLLGGATTAAALYARSRQHAGGGAAPKER